MSKQGVDNVDNRDIRSGAYHPINEDSLPQPAEVNDRTTNRQRKRWGADVRVEALPGAALPEGLLRPRRDPLNRRTGRRKAE